MPIGPLGAIGQAAQGIPPNNALLADPQTMHDVDPYNTINPDFELGLPPNVDFGMVQKGFDTPMNQLTTPEEQFGFAIAHAMPIGYFDSPFNFASPNKAYAHMQQALQQPQMFATPIQQQAIAQLAQMALDQSLQGYMNNQLGYQQAMQSLAQQAQDALGEEGNIGGYGFGPGSIGAPGLGTQAGDPGGYGFGIGATGPAQGGFGAPGVSDGVAGFGASSGIAGVSSGALGGDSVSGVTGQGFGTPGTSSVGDSTGSATVGAPGQGTSDGFGAGATGVAGVSEGGALGGGVGIGGLGGGIGDGSSTGGGGGVGDD